ncbi:MAG TPA: N-6 DNA methylase [Terriglobales bacterium]
MNSTAELQKYGVSRDCVRSFASSPSPDLIDYLDLLQAREKGELVPDGVAETQGRPLLFFINESRLSPGPAEQNDKLRILCRDLACRGERAYLARILPGELKVAPVSLQDRTARWKLYQPGTSEALTFFSNLALGRYEGDGEPATADEVFGEMFELLEQGANRLAEYKIPGSTVLSLVGRALFVRFLLDRQIVSDDDISKILPKAGSVKSCFDTPQNAAAICTWLDRTFNGDFLHLPENGGLRFFRDVGAKTNNAVFAVLGAIVRSDEFVAEDVYQSKFDWAIFNFAHIPVGLLSQVYEKFIWRWEQHSAKSTSVHYTPKNIAATLVEEAFHDLPDAQKARVLDPACGAGVFLVLAFRKLYLETWRARGARPNTKVIRDILEKQLTGLDVSESALKLSALSLYLTAIELDPHPVPPENLRFKNLRGRVLFNPRKEHQTHPNFEMGSLVSPLNLQLSKRFDLVVSNPPWTSVPKSEKRLATEFTKVSRDVIRRRGTARVAERYQNPDNAPDLPFLWKSTEWCRVDGRIAMALPARILLKQENVPRRARETIFNLLDVTGIINGSNLSDTNVWPEMQQPFILLFAQNRQPKPDRVIRFINLLYDDELSRLGELRVDSKSVEAVDPTVAAEESWLWKALAVGTSLDIDVVRKLQAAKGRPLRQYWEKDLRLVSRDGYQIKPNQVQQDASFLQGLPDLNDTKRFDFVVDTTVLDRFHRPTVCWPRERKVYAAPLVLIKESPGRREEGWALISFADVAFNQSFYGYSAAGHPNGEVLVRYVHLLVHSILWMHYALLTSPKFGAERRSVYKSVLDDFPVIPLDRLTSAQHRDLLRLSSRLEQSDRKVFSEIDEFFARMYQLDDLDLEVIRDTLDVALPYKESRDRACAVPTTREQRAFGTRLQALLGPFFDVLNKKPEVGLQSIDHLPNNAAPFTFLILRAQGVQPEKMNGELLRDLLSLAVETGATRMIHENKSGVIVGLLNQYRYWTPSRARLLAAEILRHHMASFEVN